LSPSYSSAAGPLLALLATLIGVAGALLGVSSLIGAPRKIVPFSGGLLMGIAMFGVLPELAQEHGWTIGAASLLAGVTLLWSVGRYIYPVCPSCSHTHDHEHCATMLHGFALPLVTAASIHSLLDGLGIAASQQDPSRGLATTVVAGVMLHKVPEGIALGIMLRAAVRSRMTALAWCVGVEGATFAGALLESAMTGRLGLSWVGFALGLAGGSFLYLGFHAVHGEWRRRGEPPLLPALGGAAGAAALLGSARVLFH
jgi:zinc and cadmium transporter